MPNIPGRRSGGIGKPPAKESPETKQHAAKGGTLALSPLMSDRPPAAAPIVATTKPEEKAAEPLIPEPVLAEAIAGMGVLEEKTDRISDRDLIPSTPEPKPEPVTFIPKGETAIPPSRAGQTGETMHVSAPPESADAPVGVSPVASSVGPPERGKADITTKPGATPPPLPSKTAEEIKKMEELTAPNPNMMRRGTPPSILSAPALDLPRPPEFGGSPPLLPAPPPAPAPLPGTGMEAKPAPAAAPPRPPPAYGPKPAPTPARVVRNEVIAPLPKTEVKVKTGPTAPPEDREWSLAKGIVGAIGISVLAVIGFGAYMLCTSKTGEPPQPRAAASESVEMASGTATEVPTSSPALSACVKLTNSAFAKYAPRSGTIDRINWDAFDGLSIRCAGNALGTTNTDGTGNFSGLSCELCPE